MEPATTGFGFGIANLRPVFARRSGSHRTVAIVRDAVEIAAIVAAGVWAVYTFVYEQHLKPAAEPPTATITGSLQRLGERAGLVQYAYNAVVHNIGTTRIYIIAEGVTVVGSRYTTSGAPFTSSQGGVNLYLRNARASGYVLIFRLTELSRYANPSYEVGFVIDPGEDVPFSGVFLVRRSDADNITLYGSLAYARNPQLYPTTILYTPVGAAYFNSTNHDAGYHSIEVSLDRASLW